MCVLALTEEKKATIELELVQAELQDVRNVKSNVRQADGTFKTIYERRFNLPFWLKSFVTDEVEPACYFLDDHHKPKEIQTFLEDGRMFIHKTHKRN